MEGSSSLTVKIYLSTGSSFAAPFIESGISGSDEAGVGLADVNGDGRSELIVGAPGTGGTSGVAAFVVLLRDSDVAEETTWTLTSLGTMTTESEVGDFNGDGITDVIARRNGQYQLANGPVDNLMDSA